MMEKFTKYLFILLTLFMIALIVEVHSMIYKHNQEMSEEGKMLYGFIGKESKRLGMKYNMSLGAIGGGVNKGKIVLMSLDFQRKGSPLTEEEARQLIISCLNDYLADVNADEEVRPFLQNFPFTFKNIDLAIHNYYPDGNDVSHPYIVTVSASEGEIGYFTKNTNRLKYYSEKYETYEEAVAILSKEKEKDQNKTAE